MSVLSEDGDEPIGCVLRPPFGLIGDIVSLGLLDDCIVYCAGDLRRVNTALYFFMMSYDDDKRRRAFIMRNVTR
jgi:hypothetical protein